MTPEQAYEEALCRIREAERTGGRKLNLSGLKERLELTGLEITRLPPELERLTSLQTLDISRCSQLSGDLSPLADLISLQSLDLSWCEQLSGDLSPLTSLTSLQSLDLEGCEQLSGDLSPLAGLTSLQSLDLSYCRDFRRFAPLESLLPTLKKLYLPKCVSAA